MRAKPTYEELAQRVKVLESESFLQAKCVKPLSGSNVTYRDLVEGLDDIVWTLDLDLKTTYVSPSIEKMLGFSPRERMAQDPSDQMTPNSYARMTKVLAEELAREGHPGVDPDRRFRLEVEYYHKDGSVRWFENTVSALRDEHGNLSGIRGLSRDISDRKHTEEALRDSKELFEKTFANQLDAILILDAEVPAAITDCNPAAEKMFGYSRREMLGRSVAFLHVNEEMLQRFQKELFPKIDQEGFLHMAEFQMKRKDGTLFPTEHSIVPIQDEEGERIGWVSAVRDITFRKQAEEERLRLEAELQEREKLEAIATLAGGIAHQFNNALTPIIGNVDLLEMKHKDDARMMRSLGHMKTSARHMAYLTRQLLAYARGGKYHPQNLSFPEFVASILPLMEHVLHGQIRVETDLSPQPVEVKADPTQMQMVLSALMANSSEAIEGPGRIRISVKQVALDRDFLKDHPPLKPGHYACLSVEDDGKGMDEETRSHVFEPFFTTHFMGRGLGLASVYGVVRNHEGIITIASRPGRGTAVRIYLPVMEPTTRAPVREISKPADMEVARGGVTILVIEDDEMVMELTRSILKNLGYQTLAAMTGKQAVDLARMFDGDIDLAVLDIRLPDMSGNDVYPRLMEARPGLKVVVCSGYAIDGPARELLDAGADGFIQKPFSVSTFSEKITELLQKRGDTDDTRTR